MAINSKIEWTEATWNPVTGCTKISSGCKNCYACNLARRLQSMGNIRYKNGFDITLHEDLIELPLKWKKSRIIFVNSMSDLFHEDIPDEFIMKVFETMNNAHWHTFQILTKRSERLKKLAPYLNWTDNIWQGVTVENQEVVGRINDLKCTEAKVKFISFEPLVGEINNMNLENIDWAIVGGESGPGARPMEYEWIKIIQNECLKHKVPFFFKQWGGTNRKKTGRELDGQLWNEYPNIVHECKQESIAL